jgi:DNA (cytosine-5)-methyltransferase 1
MRSIHKISAIDLFCGVGGLTKGLIQAGIKVNLGIDIDPSCEYPYARNNRSKFLLKSVAEVKGRDLLECFDPRSFKLLAGCAPCQTFSTYNQKATAEDDRWWLLSHFQRLVGETDPDFVSMENVPGLLEKDVFKSFNRSLRRRGYHVWYDVVDCAKYGVPQTRNRLVLLASKYGQIKLLEPSRYTNNPKTVREAISMLEPIEAGYGSEDDPVHFSSELSELNMRRIQSSHPGGTWRDWPFKLRAECHKKKTGKTYPAVYGRMEWDKPSPTLTTQFYGFGSGRFGHPEQNRAISIREGALLQSFPANYRFFPDDSHPGKKALGRLIGNAVPVKLGKVIGCSILQHAKSTKR